MPQAKLISPFTLPIYLFEATILLGSFLLTLEVSSQGQEIQWIDALFTATSATCVTGLAVVDVGSTFSLFGQGVILTLIQLGGLGIMTYTSLIFYLLRNRISLTDRTAVSQSLLSDPKFNLRRFLVQVIGLTLICEGLGAIFLLGMDGGSFTWFSAVFHAVSAFCNAGFSTFPDSLMRWRGDLGVNGVVMSLIVLGGLGFYVNIDLKNAVIDRIRGIKGRGLSWRSRIVLKTSGFLILAGWALILVAEWYGQPAGMDWLTRLITALFQSVTCRTAGFNSLDIGMMTDVSLLVMILLMYIGGSPGSCAGGIKTTTFRAIVSFSWSQLAGRRQTVIKGFGLDRQSLNNALTLTIFSAAIIGVSTMVLMASEGGTITHILSKGRFMEILFEVVSAFGTVGLSTGLTPSLTIFGKVVIIGLMFVGRLGPIVFVSALQTWQVRERFSWPETSLPMG